MIKEYQKQISKIYENIREEETRNYKARIDEVTKKFPQILELDKTIQKLSLNLSLSILRGASEENIEACKYEISYLRNQRHEMLASQGLPDNYLSLWYRCNKCEDTGVYKAKRCSCYKEKLAKLYYDKSDIKALLDKNNFDNFDLNLYSNRKSNDERFSAYSNMENIINYVHKDYLPNFNESNSNLLFFGKSGMGKTFFSCCIAKILLDCGYLVVYKTSDELIKALRDVRFNNNTDLEDLLINCDLLIIDDLGAEQITDFSTTELFTLINKKILKNKKMIISTNLSVIDLVRTYSERISSRLTGNFKILKFYNEEDIRVKLNLRR